MFLRIAKDRLPETVQANRQQLNPETVHSKPWHTDTETTAEPPFSYFTAPPTMVHMPMVSPDDLPVSHGDPAMFKEEPSCQEEPPLIGQPSPSPVGRPKDP